MRQFDLQRIRIEHNLTQKKVAELTGYPQGFVSVIERGKASAPEAFIEKVRELFGIEDISTYIKEVANITIKKGKKSQEKTDISTDRPMQPTAEIDPNLTVSPEQSIVTKFLELLSQKERKIEKLEAEIEALRNEVSTLKEGTSKSTSK